MAVTFAQYLIVVLVSLRVPTPEAKLFIIPAPKKFMTNYMVIIR